MSTDELHTYKFATHFFPYLFLPKANEFPRIDGALVILKKNDPESKLIILNQILCTFCI